MSAEKKHYRVYTQTGEHDTWATSPEKAKANIRHRLGILTPSWSWEVCEVK